MHYTRDMFRLRLGIVLVALSWFPFAQIGIWIAHNHNMLTTPESTNLFRAVVWGLQVFIGIIGWWVAGEIAVRTAKSVGWRQTPKKLWVLFLGKASMDARFLEFAPRAMC